MRATLCLALIGLTATVATNPSRRYVVVPAGDVDDRSRPCRAALSSDGRLMAFDAAVALDPADTNGQPDVYVLDLVTERVTLVSRNRSGGTGRGASRCPSLSADGQRVVFESDAADLVDDDTPGTGDVFFLDRAAGQLRRLSRLPAAGARMAAQAAISADGRTAVFHARDLDGAPSAPTRVYRVALDAAEAAATPLAIGHSPSVSGDGQRVAYVTRLRTGGPSVIRVLGPDGTDLAVGQAGSQPGDRDSYAPALSADGRWITYVSKATGLGGSRRLSGRAHVYLERLDEGVPRLISVSPTGREANGYSAGPSVDAAGRTVVFESSATNMGCGRRGRPDCQEDINLLADIFLWDAGTGEVTRVNVPAPELPWLEGGVAPALSADGGVVAFRSRQPVSEADDRDTFELFVLRR